MSVVKMSEDRGKENLEDGDLLGTMCSDGEHISAGTSMEAEKRIRREIANSNERRRMQSINAGFQSLRTLLPHHEGEKLSKAAILQQTAEYIYNLEQEKTRLLSQNCQLMRQVHQHEGGEIPPKKRKTDVIVPLQAVSESSDEGLGSMSPEPVGLVAVVNNAGNELMELRRQLDRERGIRMHLEDTIRQLEAQMYQPIQYQAQEIIDHSDDMRGETLIIQEQEELVDMQLVTAENLPVVGQTQTVVCSPPMTRSPSPIMAPSPCVVEPQATRLPSALEAAIKAEPKVEVERLPTPNPHDDVSCGRLYVANTSRQNLETIVEAIRHLEGDHLFSDEPTTITHTLPQQEVPLALTNKPQERILKVGYIPFHASTVQQQQQSRPGVIVVKQHS